MSVHGEECDIVLLYIYKEEKEERHRALLNDNTSNKKNHLTGGNSSL